jgi:(p)ppGpp synthase/HD superfamily hydrolase
MSVADHGAGRSLPEFVDRSRLVADALRFAVEAHAGPRRRGDTHIEHPTDVACLLADAGYPEHVVAAALLHDVVEDTATAIGGIRSRFGPRVAGLVAEVTEDAAIGEYGPRKAALRAQAAGDGEEAAAIFRRRQARHRA